MTHEEEHALRRDAERYRWLRCQHQGVQVVKVDEWGQYAPMTPAVDELVDQAMRENWR